jgi:hypothetical protein
LLLAELIAIADEISGLYRPAAGASVRRLSHDYVNALGYGFAAST